MSITQEYKLQRLISQCYSFFGREEKQAEVQLFNRLDQVNEVLTENIRESFIQYSPEIIIKFAEAAVEVQQRRHYAENIISLYFQRYKDPNQFYIRALLVKAQLVGLKGHADGKKGEQLIEVLRQSLGYVSKALDLIAGPQDSAPAKGKDSKGDPNATNNKTKYAFLIYNASNCVYKIIRFMMKPNCQKNFADIVQRVYKLLEQVDEPDHNWRCRFTWILYQCLYDAQKKPDAYKILDLLWQRTKNKPCDFQQALFRARVHISKENSALAAVIKKDLEGPSDERGWRILEVLQKIKSGLIPQPQVQKQLMGTINQISSAVLTGNQSSANNLSPIMQERLAEAGRVALQFNLTNIANSVCNYISKVRQPTQKTMVLNEYNKAQLLIKKPGPAVDSKTGMKLNSIQLKLQQIERRTQALKTLEKVMIINKRLNDADLIYEGSVLIWNTCLPFMTQSYRQLLTKAFEAASSLLEQIDSNDHALRVKLHLELAKAYFVNQSQFFRVQEHLNKALALDSSIPLAKLSVKPEQDEDPSLYQRPYERYLQSLKEKTVLKKNTLQSTPTELDRITMDLWNVVGQKSQNTRIDILQKCLGNLVNIQQKEYDIEEARQRFLVDDEIRKEMVEHKQQTLRELKRKKLLAAETAQLAFQWEINEVAEKACEFVVMEKWDPKNALEIIISQAKCYYFLAQIHIDEMLKDNFEVAFAEPIRIQDEDEEVKVEELTAQQKQQILQKKRRILSQLTKGMELSEQSQQSWLIFNGAIYVWNNFVHVFKNPKNDSLLIPELTQLLKVFFEAMKNSLKEIEKKQIITFDLDSKIQVLANIGLVYARQAQNLKQPDEANRICQTLLATQLTPHTRKLINSIKSRVSSGGGKGAPPPKPADKGAKPPAGAPTGAPTTNNAGDSFLFEIFSQLQIIKNSVGKGQNEALIKKCFEDLESRKAKNNDETELQLNAQLWARLASLALNENTITMYKYALRCVEYSLSLLDPNTDMKSIPPNRMRWYSLAEYLYSDALLKIVNPQTQQPQNCQRLLFAALDHAVEAANKGLKCGINILVTDASKQVWNICARLQESATNRQQLIKPLYNTISDLKAIKQKTETDLIMLLTQLFFKAALENQEFKMGEAVADMLFQLVPKNLQRPLWEAKMIFMSKQGKNELQAISNMKEADASLQAKLWVRLARVSTQETKQNAAYNKAIEILKKENSVEIVQVLIEYSEFKLRSGSQRVHNIFGNLLLAADYLIDIEYGEDNDEEDIEEDRATVFSRSTRGKRSQHSSSQKSRQSKAKKQPDKKSVVSVSKSKGSRMNRTARVAKTVKSKNTKSVFAQRQEESNPESLNCAHYERLFRIHTILAWISQSSEERIRYALDAKEFLIKILQVSFRTLNTMEQNAAKYSNVIDEKKELKPQEFVKKYVMPVSSEDWIKLTLSKQFLEKVKTYEDFNFMGVFLFEKAELTYTYITYLIDMLDALGFQIQTLPLHFFVRFLSKQIINNGTLQLLSDLKYYDTLRKCNFPKYLYENIVNTANLVKFKLSDQDRKLALNKTQSLKAKPNVQTEVSKLPSPCLVKPFSQRIYELWVRIAQQFVSLGEIPKAKDLTKEALKHCKILSDIETMCRCYLLLTRIAYLEGQLAEATTNCMTVNKMCKDIRQWLIVYPIVFKILAKIQKFDELRNMGTSALEVVGKLIKDNEKDSKNYGMSHEQQLLEMKHFYTCIIFHNIKLDFLELLDEPTLHRLQKLLESINRVEVSSELSHQNQLLPSSLYSFFSKLSNQLLQQLEQNSFQNAIPANCQKVISSCSSKLLKILNRMEQQIMNALKYTSISVEQQVFLNNNPLITVHNYMRLAIARAYVFNGMLRRILRFGPAEDEQLADTVQPLPDFQPLRKYMMQLNIQIQKALTLVPKRLESTETAVSILTNLEAKIPKDSYLYIIWGVEMCSAKRKLAQNKEQMGQVWSGLNEQQTQDAYAVSSLQQCISFLDKFEDRLDNILSHPASLSYSKRFYVEMLQNTGVLLPDRSFEALTKYQHYAYSEKVFKRVLFSLESNSKLVAYQRLIRQFSQPIPQIEQQLSQNVIFQNLTKFQNFNDCLKILPTNHVTIVLQYSLDMSEMYFSYCCNLKGSDVKYHVHKHKLDPKERALYAEIKREMTSIRTTLSKVPIDETDMAKYMQLITETNKKLGECMEKLEKLSSWWTDQLEDVLNLKKNEVAAVMDVKDVKKGGKEAAKASKKGGKDEVSAYESPLGTSPSGIESVTLLLDTNLVRFPLEHLPVFKSVPAISRDNSLFYLCRKFRQIGFKPQLNNSNGLGADRSKFVCYDYKIEEYSGQAIINTVMKDAPAFKFEGISSKKRIPSIGQYQKYLSSGGILHIYSPCSFISTIKCRNLLNTLQANKVRLMVVLDSLNARKSTLEKYDPVDKGESLLVEEEEEALTDILNLMSVSVVRNRWSPAIENVIDITKKLYKALGEEIYVGAAVKKATAGENAQNWLGRMLLVYNGANVARVV